MKRLRRSIRICALILTLVMILPMVYGGYSLLRYGTRWRTSEYNTYLPSIKAAVTAGSIYDRNGVRLASTTEGINAAGETVRTRVYAEDENVRRAMVHVVGDTRGNVKNAAESFFSEYLYGMKAGYLERLLQLGSGREHGDDITLTVDSALSAYIASVFPKGKNGAVIVMNYKTGELYALCSFPEFDPAGSTVTLSQATNRATRWYSAPGSTFKIVTLAAALQNIQNAENRSYLCTGGVAFGEHERTVSDYRNEIHGTLTLKSAFAQSCNSTFAILASEMGDKTLRRTAEAFGVGDDFTFRDLVVENSAYANSEQTLMGADLAWTGVGQNQLALTPLHMCMIGAAVANNGVMMEPRLLMSAVGAGGVRRLSFESAVYRTAMTPEIARTVSEYMRDVVVNGTGRNAAVSGLRICGKTGSAEIDTQENENAWFVGFIDDDAHPYALCVVVAEGGTGGSVAAPVAQKIFQYMNGKSY